MVSNEGLQSDSALDEMTLTRGQTVIDVDLTWQFLCARVAAR
jgi:glucose 1-dehydrogenase